MRAYVLTHAPDDMHATILLQPHFQVQPAERAAKRTNLLPLHHCHCWRHHNAATPASLLLLRRRPAKTCCCNKHPAPVRLCTAHCGFDMYMLQAIENTKRQASRGSCNTVQRQKTALPYIDVCAKMYIIDVAGEYLYCQAEEISCRCTGKHVLGMVTLMRHCTHAALHSTVCEMQIGDTSKTSGRTHNHMSMQPLTCCWHAITSGALACATRTAKLRRRYSERDFGAEDLMGHSWLSVDRWLSSSTP
jgi:hypothetical protein